MLIESSFDLFAGFEEIAGSKFAGLFFVDVSAGFSRQRVIYASIKYRKDSPRAGADTSPSLSGFAWFLEEGGFDRSTTVFFEGAATRWERCVLGITSLF